MHFDEILIDSSTSFTFQNQQITARLLLHRRHQTKSRHLHQLGQLAATPHETIYTSSLLPTSNGNISVMTSMVDYVSKRCKCRYHSQTRPDVSTYGANWPAHNGFTSSYLNILHDKILIPFFFQIHIVYIPQTMLLNFQKKIFLSLNSEN